MWLAAVAHGAPSTTHGLFAPPAILPKVGYAAPDVTVVRQPYVVHHIEPIAYRQPAAVYYADPPALHQSPALYHVTYHQQPPAAAAAAAVVYQAAPYTAAHTVVDYAV